MKMKSELSSLKNNYFDYKTINKRLRHSINILRKHLISTNLSLIQTQKTTNRQIKVLNQNKTRAIEKKQRNFCWKYSLKIN